MTEIATRSVEEANLLDEDNRIYLHTEFTITSGKVDDFKEIFQELLDVVKEKEPETLQSAKLIRSTISYPFQLYLIDGQNT